MSAVAINQSASAWEQLDQLEEDSKHLRKKYLKAQAEVKRCQEEAKVHDAKQGALAHARAALEAVHAKKASGEYVSRGDIQRAETALRKAEQEAQSAAHAAAGIRAAAKKYETEFDELGTKLARNRTSAIQCLRPILLDEHSASITEYRKAMEVFTAAAEKHHGEIRALFDFAMRLNLGDCGIYPNNGADQLTLPTTGTHNHPVNIHSVDLRPGIATAAKTKTTELQQLLP
jgi:chromosome segregation ATPase